MTDRKTLQKDMEYLANAIDHSDAIADNLEAEFEKSVEGQEYKSLKEMVDNRLHNVEVFLTDFVPHVDQVNAIVNHYNDPKFMKQAHSLSSDLKQKVLNKDIPDFNTIHFINSVIKQIESLQASHDIHKFREAMDEIIIRFRDRSSILAKRLKIWPEAVEKVQNFEIEIMVLRYLLFRLSTPEMDDAYVRKLMGKWYNNPKKMHDLIIEKIAALQGKAIETIAPQIDRMFVNARNDIENWQNINQFGQIMNDEGDKNIFMQVIRKSFHEKKLAGMIESWFAKGARDPKNTPRKLAAILNKILKDEAGILAMENNAKKELLELVKSEKKRLIEHAEKLRVKFLDTYKRRMEELLKKHSTILEQAKKFKSYTRLLSDDLVGLQDSVAQGMETEEALIRRKIELQSHTNALITAMQQAHANLKNERKAVDEGKIDYVTFKAYEQKIGEFIKTALLPKLSLTIQHINELEQKVKEFEDKKKKKAEEDAKKLIEMVEKQSRIVSERETKLTSEMGKQAQHTLTSEMPKTKTLGERYAEQSQR